jgi:hypothetical protein
MAGGNTPTRLLLLRWQPALLSFVRCRSIGSFIISHNPTGLLICKSALWQQGSWVRVASKWINSSCGQQSKGVTRVRPSGMLIPTAGLLHLRQASMDVVVSLSRAHAATIAARHDMC